MTFADGWVCQSCWKSNRPKDTRCYRCKTERGADKAAVAAGRERRASEVARQARVPALVSGLPATVFSWYGRLILVSGVLFLLLTPLVTSHPDAPENTLLFWLGISLGTIAAGIAMRWASGAMRTANPWAFLIALVVSVGLVGGTLWAMSLLPPGMGNPVWMRYITITVFGLSGILALVGLLFSLTGDAAEGTSGDNA